LSEHLHQGVDERLSRDGSNAEGRRDRRRDQLRVRDRGEIDKDESVTVALGEPRRELEREPRLAASTGPSERNEPAFAQEALELVEFALAADKPRQVRR
jgi:hypothetical protein